MSFHARKVNERLRKCKLTLSTASIRRHPARPLLVRYVLPSFVLFSLCARARAYRHFELTCRALCRPRRSRHRPERRQGRRPSAQVHVRPVHLSRPARRRGASSLQPNLPSSLVLTLILCDAFRSSRPRSGSRRTRLREVSASTLSRRSRAPAKSASVAALRSSLRTRAASCKRQLPRSCCSDSVRVGVGHEGTRSQFYVKVFRSVICMWALECFAAALFASLIRTEDQYRSWKILVE